MVEKELYAYGIGDVPTWLADEGLELAITYFQDNEIDPQDSFNATKSNNNSELTKHWDIAGNQANRVLLSRSRYDNSLIILDFGIH